MKHLVICDYGTFVGLNSHRLAISQGDNTRNYPLNRLQSVSIAKRGVSISSDVIEEFSERGIKLYFLDYRGVASSAIIGQSQHGVVSVRLAQMNYCRNNPLPLAKLVVSAKIKNQRAVLKHLDKYHQNPALQIAADALSLYSKKSSKARDFETLLGFEGSSAHAYFQALRSSSLFSSSFVKREGRGSQEINNCLLNLGYSVLSSYILNCIVNAGLEPYLGFLHQQRPGKMALVLDLMEEYRAWVVDRSVVKLRSKSEGSQFLDPALKKSLISEVQRTCSRKYQYKGKKLKLEHIMQRQIYRLCGNFFNEKKYSPYLFKW